MWLDGGGDRDGCKNIIRNREKQKHSDSDLRRSINKRRTEQDERSLDKCGCNFDYRLHENMVPGRISVSFFIAILSSSLSVPLQVKQIAQFQLDFDQEKKK